MSRRKLTDDSSQFSMIEARPLLEVSKAKKLKAPCIYALCDTAGMAFYVGKTINPGERFSEHLRPAGGHNPVLKEKIKKLGVDLRVCILCEDPPDINAAERREIASRPWIVNMVGPHHWAWQCRSDKPWAAGSGIWCPSQLSIRATKDQTKKQTCRAFLRSLTPAERCVVEIELYREFPLGFQRRLNRWLDLAQGKMLACLEGQPCQS